MRKLLFAVPILALIAVAGCVWPPDSAPTVQYIPPYISYDIHRISQRSLAGIESLVTIVSPYNSNTGTYVDSVLYILVNGDTVYRHPSIVSPTVIDSSAPYRFDGSSNVVAMVFPSVTVFDTSYVSDISEQITSPPYGDTIYRTLEASFNYLPNTDDYYNGYFQITDSVNFYSQNVDEYDGSLDFPPNELETFQGGTLWAMLHYNGTAESNDYYNYYDYGVNRTVELDRIVAYPLH